MAMRVLILCTAHNSLSQRISLVLSKKHSVTVEYALSATTMIEAAQLARPNLIICPFLTTRVPEEVYSEYLTLIVHPGPPGDAGPSALDWLLMGDDGTEPDSSRLVERDGFSANGRSHWGVTVLQAIGELDAGQVWAFEQFPVDINKPGLTKSSLYRGPVTKAAVSATLAAIERIEAASTLRLSQHGAPLTPPLSPGDEVSSSRTNGKVHPGLAACQSFGILSVTSKEPFLGGQTRSRPLLKASQRDFDAYCHSAAQISRRIRSGDSQPGCLSAVFGPNLYLYGGVIEETVVSNDSPGKIITIRDDAVCIATCDRKGVWITHIRRVKAKADPALWPKVPAAPGLAELGIIHQGIPPPFALSASHPSTALDPWMRKETGTLQEIWVDIVADHGKRMAYVYFDLYNGAMSTGQCRRLVKCLRALLLSEGSRHPPLAAVVLMGGDSYFSNGIHLNVIEAAADPALESWFNINAIDDVVELILDDYATRSITTVAAIRGNCAAGGVALAAACDIVLAGEHVVLNPAYRTLGLHGSEYHSLSYIGRCGVDGAASILRDMMPLSADDALRTGLVDVVLPSLAESLDASVRRHVSTVMATNSWPFRDHSIGRWKQNMDLSTSIIAQARATELAQMSMDFWSARSERYHQRRRAFVRKAKPTSTPLRFAKHRRGIGALDQEEHDCFDSVEWFAERSRQDAKMELCAQVMGIITDFSKLAPVTTKEGGFVAGQRCDCRSDGSAANLATNRPRAAFEPLFACYYTA